MFDLASAFNCLLLVFVFLLAHYIIYTMNTKHNTQNTENILQVHGTRETRNTLKMCNPFVNKKVFLFLSMFNVLI